jgi:hypothetical protein
MSDGDKSNMSAEERFHAAIADRVRGEIGELIPEEILVEKIDAVLHKAFFEPIVVREKTYSREAETIPSRVEQLVTILLAEQVGKHVKDFLERHDELVQDTIKEAIKDGIGTLIVSRINQYFQSSQGRLSEIENKLNQAGIY